MYYLHLSIKDQLAVESGPKSASPIRKGQRLSVRSRAVLSSACPLIVRPSVVDEEKRELPLRISARLIEWAGGDGEPSVDLFDDEDGNPSAVMCDLKGTPQTVLEIECQSVGSEENWSATVNLIIKSTTQPLLSHEITQELAKQEFTRERAEAINQLVARARQPHHEAQLRDRTLDSIKNRVNRILEHLQKGNRLAEEHRHDLFQDLQLKLLELWDRGRVQDVTEFVNGLHTTLDRLLIDLANKENRQPISGIDESADVPDTDSRAEMPSGDATKNFHRAIVEAWRRLRVRTPFQTWCRCIAAVARRQEHDIPTRRAAIDADPTMSVDEIGGEFSRQKQAALEGWAKEILGRPELGVMAPEFVSDLMNFDERSLEARIPRLKRALEDYVQERPALAEELFGDA